MNMASPLIAIVGDANPNRKFSPPMKNPAKAITAAEEIGTELAKRGARLLVYGGPFIEADVVRGFVAGKPAEDRCIVKWYTKDQEPPPFPEESSHPKLFEQRVEKGVDWEIAFYRSIAMALSSLVATTRQRSSVRSRSVHVFRSSASRSSAVQPLECGTRSLRERTCRHEMRSP